MEPRKWKKYYNLPEIVSIRKKIVDTYSNKLKFIEESHQYFIGEVEFKCVSDVVDGFSSVDEEAMLERCAIKALKYPDYKYFGMTKDEIAALWKRNSGEACSFGTKVHSFGEACFYWYTGQDEKIPKKLRPRFTEETGPIPTNKHEEAVLKFWNDLPENIVPVLSETKVFNVKGSPYAGTFDILFYYYNEENPEKSGLLVMDYKTNASLTNSYTRDNNERMLAPFNDLIEESLSHYQIQLQLYTRCIEDLGYKVLGKRVIWLKPDGTYDKIKMKNLKDKVDIALEMLSEKNKKVI